MWDLGRRVGFMTSWGVRAVVWCSGRHEVWTVVCGLGRRVGFGSSCGIWTVVWDFGTTVDLESLYEFGSSCEVWPSYRI